MVGPEGKLELSGPLPSPTAFLDDYWKWGDLKSRRAEWEAEGRNPERPKKYKEAEAAGTQRRQADLDEAR
jgi:hypothetical protein